MSKLAWGSSVLICAGLVLALASHREAIAKFLRPDPVRVLGTLKSGGRPVAGAHVTFLLNGSDVRHETKTTSRGQFVLEVAQAGDYSASFGMSPMLPWTSRDVTLTVGRNELNIDLPRTRVDVKLRVPANGPQPTLIQLALWGRGSRSAQRLGGIVTTAREGSAKYLGLDYGDYQLTAFSGNGEFVSVAPVRFVLDSLHTVAEARLEMTVRRLDLVVTDPKGLNAETATVSSFGQRSPQIGPGHFDASRIPFGQLTIVTAPGFLPVCTHAAGDATQNIVLPDKADGVADLRLHGGPRRPVGFLYGLPGSDCGVPLGLLDLKWQPPVAEAYLALRIEGLPHGSYEYRAQEWIPGIRFSVPGGVIDYDIPSYCKFCGG